MNNISNALHLLLAIFAIWYLSICWSDYRLDILRQRMFAVRDDLFLSAAQGEIEFSSNAYLRLRKLMNGMIRYAHRRSIPQMFISWLAIKSVKRESFFDLWDQDLALLPEDQRVLMQDAHKRMQLILTRHLDTSFSGVLLYFLLMPAIVFPAIARLFRSSMDTHSTKDQNMHSDREAILIRGIRPLEDETYMLETRGKDSEFELAHS